MSHLAVMIAYFIYSNAHSLKRLNPLFMFYGKQTNHGTHVSS